MEGPRRVKSCFPPGTAEQEEVGRSTRRSGRKRFYLHQDQSGQDPPPPGVQKKPRQLPSHRSPNSGRFRADFKAGKRAGVYILSRPGGGPTLGSKKRGRRRACARENSRPRQGRRQSSANSSRVRRRRPRPNGGMAGGEPSATSTYGRLRLNSQARRRTRCAGSSGGRRSGEGQRSRIDLVFSRGHPQRGVACASANTTSSGGSLHLPMGEDKICIGLVAGSGGPTPTQTFSVPPTALQLMKDPPLHQEAESRGGQAVRLGRQDDHTSGGSFAIAEGGLRSRGHGRSGDDASMVNIRTPEGRPLRDAAGM